MYEGEEGEGKQHRHYVHQGSPSNALLLLLLSFIQLPLLVTGVAFITVNVEHAPSPVCVSCLTFQFDLLTLLMTLILQRYVDMAHVHATQLYYIPQYALYRRFDLIYKCRRSNGRNNRYVQHSRKKKYKERDCSPYFRKNWWKR